MIFGAKSVNLMGGVFVPIWDFAFYKNTNLFGGRDFGFQQPALLFRFLPITFLIYYLVPFRFKNTVLFLASLFFYTWGEPKFFPVMLISIGVNYVAGLLMERYDQRPQLRRICFWLAFAITLGFLLFFKYTNFFVGNINALFGTSLPLLSSTEFHLPLGISFYTFQILAYTIDVYRRKIKVEHNLIDFGAFVVLVPAADCRTDRSVSRHQQGDETPHHHTGTGGRRCWAVYHGIGQQDFAGGHRWRTLDRGTDPGLCQRFHPFGVDGFAGIYLPDLF